MIQVDARADNQIGRYRSQFRAGLLVLGLPLVAIGAWALLAPHAWYEDFPGGGRHWISALGPYNEHLIRDFGSLYLGLGLLLVFAAVVLGRQLVQAALGTLLVFSLPHFVFHLTKTEPLSRADNIVNLVTLGLGVVLTVGLLLLTRGTGPRLAGAPAPPRGETSIEGGITHGTR